MLKLSKVFKTRWQLMDQALSKHLSMTSSAPAFGGTSYWVALPQGLSAVQLEEKAKRNNIIINAGDNYFKDENGPKNYFRLGFSSIADDKIEPGIQLLSQLANSPNPD